MEELNVFSLNNIILWSRSQRKYHDLRIEDQKNSKEILTRKTIIRRKTGRQPLRLRNQHKRRHMPWWWWWWRWWQRQGRWWYDDLLVAGECLEQRCSAFSFIKFPVSRSQVYYEGFFMLHVAVHIHHSLIRAFAVQYFCMVDTNSVCSLLVLGSPQRPVKKFTEGIRNALYLLVIWNILCKCKHVGWIEMKLFSVAGSAAEVEGH
jgi:hypothetical protein